MDLPINSSAAGGPAMGNYNPNRMDSWMADMMKGSSVNLMENAASNNPWTRALSNLGARGASGAHNSAQLSEWLNYTRAGFFMRQGARAGQGIMGSGSFVDMAFGAQQMLGMGGMRINNVGSMQTLSGGGMVTDALAPRLFNRLASYYYDDRGIAMRSRTLGRDPTEIARAMQIVGASGQLAGVSVGTFGGLSTTERLQNAYAGLKADGNTGDARTVMQTINRIRSGGMNDSQAMKEAQSLSDNAKAAGHDAITKVVQNGVLNTKDGFKVNPEFYKQTQAGIKELFKLHDVMKDIFGDIKDFEAVSMGSQITGISASSANSFTKMRSAISKLKNDAASAGMGATPYVQAVGSFGQMYGQALGSASFGAGFAGAVTPAAYLAASASQQALRTNPKGRAYSAEEITQENAKDAAALINEPGANAAAALAFALEKDPRYGKDAKAAGRIRSALGRYGSAQIGSEKDAATAEIYALRNEFGVPDISTGDALSGLSGTATGAILTDSIAGATRNSIKHNYVRRARQVGLSGKNNYGEAFANHGADILYGLESSLGGQDTAAIAELLRSGDTKGAYAMINDASNAEAFRASGTSASAIIASIDSAAGGTRGGYAGVGNAMLYTSRQLSNSGESKNLAPTKSLMEAKSTAAFKRLMDATTGNTVSKQDSLGRALADMVFSGGTASNISTNDQAIYAMTSGSVSAEEILTVNKDNDSINFSDKQLDFWSKNSDFMENLGASDVGELRSRVSGKHSSTAVLDALEKSGYITTGASVEGAAALAAVSADKQNAAENGIKKEATAKYFQQMGITGVSAEDQAKIAAGNTSDVDESTMKSIRDQERKKLKEPFFTKHVGINGHAQYIKDAIYGGNSSEAALALRALQTPGVLSDDDRSGLFHNLQKDGKLKDFVGQLGVDTSKWSTNESWDTVQQALAKVGNVNYSPQTNTDTIPHLTVTKMTVLNKD